MSTIKESLHHAIEGLSDEKAQQVLSFTQRLQGKGDISPTLERLVDDPAFNVPLEKMGSNK